MDFSFYDQEKDPLVKLATQLQYLVMNIYHTDNDLPEVHRNIGKAPELCCGWRGQTAGCYYFSTER